MPAPGDPKPLLAAGLAAHKSGDLATAERAYRQVLRLWPDHPHALHLLGVVQDGLGRHDEAIGLIRRALPALDAKPNVHNNLGNALRHAGQAAAARRHYERALAIDGAYAQAHFNLGVLHATPGPEEDLVASREHLRRALAIDPRLVPAWLELARLSRREGKLPAASELYQKVLEIDPDEVAALIDLAGLLQVTLQVHRALPLIERACELAPDSALAHFNRAQALAELGHGERAEAAHRRVLELAPDAINSRLAVAKRERDRGEWAGWDDTVAQLAHLDAAAIAQAPPPFLLNLYPVPPATHRDVARAYATTFENRSRELGGAIDPRRRAQSKERLRLGYLSADFRHHPVGHLSHGVYAALDRSRFEAFAYSLVPVDDDVTAAVRAGCDLFRECTRLSDRAIARQIADDAVDILIDLTGYTTYCRPAIVAMRPAPLQIQHLGYVNTMGAAFIDYQIVDATVVGPEQRPFFDEQLIVMPHCLFPVSPLGAIGATTARPTRADFGLPEQATVLCSFNDPSKLDPTTFDAWMAILRQAPAAVLWLYDADQPALPSNLRVEAERRGVDPGRLYFTGRRPYPEHLRRYELADLFLDSFVYNGGATAVDALRQGLPILTRLGDAPLGRMGASVARAAGLGDFVTADAAEYVALAVRLATTPGALAALHDRVRGAWTAAPLFDLTGWVRGYEAGLADGWEAAARGERRDVRIEMVTVRRGREHRLTARSTRRPV